jgi:hypothetical protein
MDAWTRQSTQCGLWHLQARSCDKIGAMSGRTRRIDVAFTAIETLAKLGRCILHYAISALAAFAALAALLQFIISPD